MSSISLKDPAGIDSKPSVDQPLYQVKLLSALRTGDPNLIHSFLAEIGKDKRSSVPAAGRIDTGAAALHLAIRCASVKTVSLLLSHRAISPNSIHPPGSGTTALHLAASLGRADIVNLLLEQEGIDDTLVDIQGKTCRDAARGKEVIKVIDESREFLNATYRSLLHSYILSPQALPGSPASSSLTALIALLESPRIRHVNLSYLDDSSGSALLHEAARRKDLRLIDLAIRAGADVFVRNRRGKTAYETVGPKDERVKVFLRQFANHDTTLLHSPSLSAAIAKEPPLALKGYLNKYTNVARGYNTRWFVLKDGVLSYYRHQEDETVASRGSISMRSCILKTGTASSSAPGGGTAGNENIRFEVHSLPSRGHSTSGVQKWYIKANHPVEAARWTQAIERSIEWYKRDSHHHSDSTSSIPSHDTPSRRSMESDQSASRVPPSQSAASLSSSLSFARKATGTPLGKKRVRLTSTATVASSSTTAPGVTPTLGLSKANAGISNVGRNGSDDDSIIAEEDNSFIESRAESTHFSGNKESGDSSTSLADDASSLAAPHEANFELAGNAVTAQIELLGEVIGKLGDTSRDSSSPESSALQALQLCYSSLQSLALEYIGMSNERSAYFKSQLKKEKDRQDFWESSLAEAVKEGEMLEKELRVRSRKRGSRFFDTGTSIVGGSTIRVGGVDVEGLPTALGGTIKASRKVSSPVAEEPPPEIPLPAISKPEDVMHPRSFGEKGDASTKMPPARQDTISSTSTRPTAPRPSLIIHRSSGPVGDHESMISTDEEDEFFDAIESNTLPNLIVPESLTSPGTLHPPPESGPQSLVKTPMEALIGPSIRAYDGYREFRSRLNLANERPSTSLWSVLKHSIGKDLTKISFPVFFNEPTSMLQRMAEDMEFSECLDVAAREPDPHKRIAFVAAFAMSNYSSTIGRIAKPFNPMLSETFEYVRHDKEYRYVSEQVSHHPPISACWAESPLWHYYGEVDAQNKFMGKSFEIRPTGVAHADLLLPPEWGPGYPKATAVAEEGKVVEHYTWKKVTTCVSGFILGAPTIDHYGDMTVVNHRTQDKCVLTFKPRGWRGKDAFEISGYVTDAQGNLIYEIAGRWNSQLIAKKVDDGDDESETLNPDASISAPTSPSSTPEYILLWRNSEKPEGSPFNLTPFAITLNDCPKTTLKPYLCPTDCRLRPDQRAFEMGHYEEANVLKQKQEEKQRATRRKREERKLPPHRPRWFTAETDGDTGERVWTPSRIEGGRLEYWHAKEKFWEQRQTGTGEWKDVDLIFIEEPDIIRRAL